jgi:hypothetical protein
MNEIKSNLIEAENKAKILFETIANRSLIRAGKSENQINNEVFKLAEELFGITKFWHKRIVRSGPNTLFPYNENPPDLIIQENDILFFDFGPIFELWEADLGRTYVLGNDPYKLAHRYGWEYGSDIAGHLIGQFPHERLGPGSCELYVHSENHTDMFVSDDKGQQRNWILEIHFIDKERKIGGFFEQLLTV